MPEAPPTEIENWEDIFKDIEPVVLAGNTHWQHPNFFAYFPTACSYHSILGDILSSGLASVGFSWVKFTFFHNPCNNENNELALEKEKNVLFCNGRLSDLVALSKLFSDLVCIDEMKFQKFAKINTVRHNSKF